MSITVYEVGPRDGLQNIKSFIDTDVKRQLISSLYEAGLETVEEVSFAHPKLVPQMADAEDVFSGRGAALVMNKRGFERAKAVGVKKFNLVFSACEVFNERNLGRNRAKTIEEYCCFINEIPKEDVRVYISMAFGSPHSEINRKLLRECVEVASTLGDTVVFADTIGCGLVKEVDYFASLAKDMDVTPALHLHHKGDESRPLSLIRAGLYAGIREFDSSIGGLGGCPFSEESGANLSTETLVRHLTAWGVHCGVEEESLNKALKIVRRIRQADAIPI